MVLAEPVEVTLALLAGVLEEGQVVVAAEAGALRSHASHLCADVAGGAARLTRGVTDLRTIRVIIRKFHFGTQGEIESKQRRLATKGSKALSD